MDHSIFSFSIKPPPPPSLLRRAKITESSAGALGRARSITPRIFSNFEASNSHEQFFQPTKHPRVVEGEGYFWQCFWRGGGGAGTAGWIKRVGVVFVPRTRGRGNSIPVFSVLASVLHPRRTQKPSRSLEIGNEHALSPPLPLYSSPHALQRPVPAPITIDLLRPNDTFSLQNPAPQKHCPHSILRIKLRPLSLSIC